MIARIINSIFLMVAIFILGAGAAFASDHRDAPYTQRNPMADIGDTFLFKGEQIGGLTMAVTLNPLSGSGAPGTAASDQIRLDPALTYIFKVDTNDDAIADLAYKIKVTDIPGAAQQQDVALRLASGADAISNDWNGIAQGNGKTTPLNGALEVVTGKSSELLFVGPRRDPFFFNFTSVQAPAALAIKQALAGGDNLPALPTSIGAFGATDMSLIVLEVPSLVNQTLNFWVVVADADGKTVDRMGRAGIQGIFFVDPPVGRNAEYYLPVDKMYPTVGDFNNAYNAGRPRDDAENFGDQFAFSFERLEVSADDIPAKLAFYVPDMLHWDPAAAPGYPNGRSFAEDAIYWTIQDVNPFLYADPDSFLPRTSDQDLNLAKFPYAAPSVNQAWAPGVPQIPVAPIYMD